MKGANHEGIKNTVIHYNLFEFGILCGAAFLSGQAGVRTGLALFNAGKYEQALPISIRPLNWIRITCKPACILADLILASADGEAIGPLRTAYRISPTETRKEATNFPVRRLGRCWNQSFRNGDYKTAIDPQEGLTLDPSSAKVKMSLSRRGRL
jgi:hypothetical protein